ncbi:MAG: mandelate racemase/muconate lactonizing enzyme family protein [bacterium]|nr:mandelate racemase/muconate lactonizing enzyme family protein [bacterium]
MKVTPIQIYHLSYPVQRPYANSCAWNRQRDVVAVAVTTDAGITGWGEGSRLPQSSVLAQYVVGRDPFDVAAIGRAAQPAGCPAAAWSGVDIALHDLMGRAIGLFLYDAQQPIATLAQEAGAYAAAGFRAVKMKIGFGARTDAARVAAVRAAMGPDVLLAVDANCAYDAATAITSARAKAEHDVYWYEEPVPPTEIQAYRQVQQAAPMQLAGGEALEGLGAFRDLVSERCLAIVQPDISIAAGFSTCQKIAALAEAHGVRTLPHMWGSAVRLAATLHWQTVLPDGPGLFPEPGLFEFDMTENALRTVLARAPCQQQGGTVASSACSRPGSGDRPQGAGAGHGCHQRRAGLTINTSTGSENEELRT